MNAIEVNGLDFSYNKKSPLLQNVNMRIPQSGIYGFLGPNGAGKTTTLKLILNLLKIDGEGEISVMGHSINATYPRYLTHIGSLIEEASVYQHLTIRKNLKIWSNYYGINSNRIDEVLEIIGLSGASRKKVAALSTGMKRRLGIGIAILHDPEILILDEPTNGLDPIGIGDLRELMRNITAQGKTILLSSHILSEVERLVDHIGVINHGSIVFEGTIQELNAKTVSTSHVSLYVSDSAIAFECLSKYYSTQIFENHIEVGITSKGDINEIVKIIIENNISLHEVIRPKNTLESLFLKLAK